MTVSTTTLLLGVMCFFLGDMLWEKVAQPFLENKGTKVLETNPKWVTSELTDKYYGFYDVDFVLVEATNSFSHTPRFTVNKKTNRYQLLFTDDITTHEVAELGRFTMICKLVAKYGIVAAKDKPLYWLSILCYMLDGGDIHQEAVSWRDTEKSE